MYLTATYSFLKGSLQDPDEMEIPASQCCPSHCDHSATICLQTYWTTCYQLKIFLSVAFAFGMIMVTMNLSAT